MADRYVEVTHQGWGSRLGDSIKGVLIGVLLFLLAFPVLWWNEGRAVTTYKSLEEGAGAVVSADSDEVDDDNDGELVHMTGEASTDEALEDPELAVRVDHALHLKRSVEMYQWVETSKSEKKKKLGGGTTTVTTYTYKEEWVDHLVDSGPFKERRGHENPDHMPYDSREWSAEEVTLGAFILSDGLKEKIQEWESVKLDDDALDGLPRDLRGDAELRGDEIYVGRDAGRPRVGDLKITLAYVPPTKVSIVAEQDGDSFRPYSTEAGDDIELLMIGKVSAKKMFDEAQAQNTMLTWILRAVGFAMMLIGVMLVFAPLVVVGDVVPLVGDLLGLGSFLAGFAVAVPLSLLTVSIAWVFYRPLLGVGLLAVAVALAVGLKVIAARKRGTATG